MIRHDGYLLQLCCLLQK